VEIRCGVLWAAGSVVRATPLSGKSTQPPRISGSDAGSERPEPHGLREREAEQLEVAAAALRACAARLPKASPVGRDLAAWADRLAFAAQVHGLFADRGGAEGDDG
jgi:hypothetical protein